MAMPPSPRPRGASASRPTKATADADALLASLDHPRLPEIHALRAIIRGVDPRIREEVKWNAPSFATTEHFATFHLRAKTGVQLVLHLGARSRPDADLRAEVADPTKLLEWRALDRATVTFVDGADVAVKGEALAAIIRQWIAFVA